MLYIYIYIYMMSCLSHQLEATSKVLRQINPWKFDSLDIQLVLIILMHESSILKIQYCWGC